MTLSYQNCTLFKSLCVQLDTYSLAALRGELIKLLKYCPRRVNNTLHYRRRILKIWDTKSSVTPLLFQVGFSEVFIFSATAIQTFGNLTTSVREL